jgi:hypothetical protein
MRRVNRQSLAAAEWIARGERRHSVATRLRDLKQRCGDRIPHDEIVVSPVASFEARELETVHQS